MVGHRCNEYGTRMPGFRKRESVGEEWRRWMGTWYFPFRFSVNLRLLRKIVYYFFLSKKNTYMYNKIKKKQKRGRPNAYKAGLDTHRAVSGEGAPAESLGPRGRILRSCGPRHGSGSRPSPCGNPPVLSACSRL